MPTYTDLLVGGTSQITERGNSLKLNTLVLDLGDATSVTATGDILKIMDLSEDLYFEVVRVEVIEAITFGAATGGALQIGDTQDADEICTAANMAAASLVAGYEVPITKATITNGIINTAAEDLIITATGTGTITLDGKLAITFVSGNCNNATEAAVSPVTP